jgi:ubiquinone/menaquinone biosynthesis C-methylase UbiE
MKHRQSLRPQAMSLDPVRYHSQQAAKWESQYKNAVFSARVDVVKNLLADADLTCQKWLDAGCGTGTLARTLAESRHCHVLGVDASAEMIANCQSSPNTEFETVEHVAHTHLPADSFDGVLCSSVIEYVEDPEATIREFARILKDGGRLLVSVPNSDPSARIPQWFFYWLTRPLGSRRMFTNLDYSKHCYSEDEFARILSKHGFRVLSSERFGRVQIELPLTHTSVTLKRDSMVMFSAIRS